MENGCERLTRQSATEQQLATPSDTEERVSRCHSLFMLSTLQQSGTRLFQKLSHSANRRITEADVGHKTCKL